MIRITKENGRGGGNRRHRLYQRDGYERRPVHDGVTARRGSRPGLWFSHLMLCGPSPLTDGTRINRVMYGRGAALTSKHRLKLLIYHTADDA